MCTAGVRGKRKYRGRILLGDQFTKNITSDNYLDSDSDKVNDENRTKPNMGEELKGRVYLYYAISWTEY